MFPPIEYLEWLSGRAGSAPFDLASAPRLDDGTGIPSSLAGATDPPAGVSLHTQLATAYGVHPRQVVVTAGASHATFLAVAAALDGETESSRVLVEKPAYEPFVRTPEGFGATVDRFLRDPSAAYALDPARVANACVEGARLVVVTNRHNPSGRLADREALAAAADVASERGARLLVDEVTAPYVADGREEGAGPFGGPTAADLEGTVVVGSLSKFPGFPELQIGWLVADAAFADRVRRVKHHVPAVSETAVALARRALHADDVAARARDRVTENAAHLAAFVADREGLTGETHPGCPFAFLEGPVDGDALAAAASEAGVLVVPGRFFGDADRVRVFAGGPPADVAVALEALGDVLDGARG